MAKKPTTGDQETRADLVQVPLPESLEPDVTMRSLMTSVKIVFFPLYNSNSSFRRYLASVGNKDSVTKNRMIDRTRAIDMIIKAGQDRDDLILMNAAEGDIYQKMVEIMRKQGLSLRIRREQYKQLTRQAA